MPDLEQAVIANRKAVTDFIAAAEAVPQTRWSEPVAPGTWSPAQAEFEPMALDLDRARHDAFEHGLFGTVGIADYGRFSELHAVHHREERPTLRPA